MTPQRAAQILSEMVAASRDYQNTQSVEVGVADTMREQIEAMELGAKALRYVNRNGEGNEIL